MKLVSIVGARPQFVKAAPVVRAVERHNLGGGETIDHRIVHTGQHYDDAMSGLFFAELELPAAAVDLGIGSASHAEQTGRMMAAIEEELERHPPDVVLVYGDTNSTLAGALAAVKLNLPTAHLEAGLRSFDRRMPEEINRVAVDHCCDLLLAPTPTALHNLHREGLEESSVLTGDVMLDAVLAASERAAARSKVLGHLGLAPGGYALATLHRAQTTDDCQRLTRLLAALESVATNVAPVVLPLHPRTAKAIGQRLPDWSPGPALRLTPPVGYLDMLTLIGNALVVLTDSGGVQKEAFFLGRPCVTLRPETEWLETVAAEMNVVADDRQAAILEAAGALAARFPIGDRAPAPPPDGPFGDGAAARRVVASVLRLADRPRR